MHAATLQAYHRWCGTGPTCQKLPGTLLALILALLSVEFASASWCQCHGVGALTIAIIMGILVGNSVYPQLASTAGAGVKFCKQDLLRLGVVLYGLRLTVQDIAQVGWTGVLIDAVMLSSTFLLAYLLGTRAFGLDRKLSLLVGAGSSICGAAAVMAAEPVVRASAEKVTVAVATVVIYGTLAIFLYPALFALNTHHPIILGGSAGFGLYIGSTVHEVAQVVAAARNVNARATDIAVIAKMVRIMMLAPMLMALSRWLARSERRIAKSSTRAEAITSKLGSKSGSLTIPWFAFVFVGVVLLNSLHILSAHQAALANSTDTLLLAVAMAALGLSTHVSAIRDAGIKPLVLGLVLFAWLVIGGAIVNRYLTVLLN